MEVLQRLDAFELRVLACPAPPVDVSTLQAAVESLRADLDTYLEARVPEYEAPFCRAYRGNYFGGLILQCCSATTSTKRAL